MGEGDPGKAITPEFYALARELTNKHQTLLLVDSIQAGLRTCGHLSIRTCGHLSIVDYPGFEELPPPDFETFSKALNAGQYPFSVLAMGPAADKLYIVGIYGNTMTTNPKALDVACEVLDSMTDEIRQNIIERGREFLEKLTQLQNVYPKVITKVQGTGLIFSVVINTQYEVNGKGGLEEYLRKAGLGVIHGGVNALRFTPHFMVTTEEVDLMLDILEQGVKSFMEIGKGVAAI